MTSAEDVAPLTTMASAIFFGAIIFTAIALSCKAMAHGEFAALYKAAYLPRSSAFNAKSLVSTYTLLVHMSVFGLILFYAYICENHPPFPHGPKSYDRDEFFFLTAMLFLVSAFTVKQHVKPKNTELEAENGHSHGKNSNGFRPIEPQNDATEVLNRDQTEEWKGWMQFMFLLYHYYHAEEVYNAIRIMITCYVWMTGFGNFSFFYIKGDYGSVRVMQMLWRLNFLVVFLCLTQGTTYILYYICLLHTYFFVMVYATMRIGKGLNYSTWGIRIKLAVLAMIIFILWETDGTVFRLIHMPFLGESPMLGATGGAMWEWYFRSSLDHWSTFLGMLFALNFPITSLFFRKLEAQPLYLQVPAKGFMAVAMIAALYWWVTGPFQEAKLDYNQTNAYYGWVPLMAYIYLRNLTPWLRGHSLDLLHQIGKTTLETYLMQHHIWLTSDAKSLLILIPGWPKVNFLLVSIIYVVLSRRLYQLTLFLRGMVLPNDRNACIRNLAYLTLSLVGSIGIAFALRSADMLNFTAIAFVSIALGSYLFFHIVYSTEAEGSPRPDAVKLASFGFGGAFTLFLLGFAWTGMAGIGAGKIQPLPSTCASSVNAGEWIAIDACSEEARGQAFREHGVDSLGTCSAVTDTFVWGWKSTPSSSLCRIAPRDKKSLLKTLSHRRIVFIGDSTVRHVYYSLCRLLGSADAGMYDTGIERHADFQETFGKTTVEFKWSPFAPDVNAKLQQVAGTKSDVVVLGGGAWDRLHSYDNQTSIEKFKSDVKVLADTLSRVTTKEMSSVWIVPTTINTPALSDSINKKKENIKEAQLAEIRALYGDSGVLDAATFVLDGPSFTTRRVAESHDGVHYPLSVYDAGSQILANAFDWLLSDKEINDPFSPKQPGSMAKPFLGLMVLGFSFMALFLFDGFLGASYIAAIFVPSVMPIRLYHDGFSALHQRLNLPPITANNSLSGGNAVDDHASVAGSSKSKGSDHIDDLDLDDERKSFLGKEENMRVV